LFDPFWDPFCQDRAQLIQPRLFSPWPLGRSRAATSFFHVERLFTKWRKTLLPHAFFSNPELKKSSKNRYGILSQTRLSLLFALFLFLTQCHFHYGSISIAHTAGSLPQPDRSSASSRPSHERLFAARSFLTQPLCRFAVFSRGLNSRIYFS